MLKRTLIIISLTVTVAVAMQPLQTVHGILQTDAESTALNATDVSVGQTPKQSGNGFVRALKAPFKALSRLFGRGRNNKNKLQRISDKDIKRFESVAAGQVIDSRSPTQTNPTESTTDHSGATALEHLEKGRLLLNDKNLNEAIGELARATSMEPTLTEAYNLLGVAYQLKGLPDQARRAFEAGLKLDEKNVQTLNNIGYLLLTNGDPKGAHKFLKKAVSLAPDNPRILNNLALAQAELGKFDAASKNFVRAGGEISGRLNAADQLLLAGRTAEAQKQFDLAKLRAESERIASPSEQAIRVLVEIKNGRISYASVSNRRPGFEAYEASALRRVRQFRFPVDKNGRESLIVKVNPAPAS